MSSIALSLLLIFNVYSAEQTSWWFKTKCHMYEHCFPDGSLDDQTCLPHGSVKLRDALFDAIERHSIPDVSYMFNFYAKTERSLVYSPWEYGPLSRAVVCNAPAEIVRIICKHTRVDQAHVRGDSTLLQVVVKNNNVDMACILLAYGYKPDTITPADLDEAAKIASFFVNVVERLSDMSINIADKHMQDIYYKERTKRIEALLNAQDAATCRIPKPLNAIIARYAVEDVEPQR
jgi:hypothetical protein